MTNNRLIYLILVIIIITFIVLFILYRRKKQNEKEEREKEEELAQESEETQTESTDEGLLPDTESSSPEVEAPQTVQVPVIEEPAEPVPVPMPAEADKPQLPSSTALDPHSEAQPPPDDTEQEINSEKLVE